MWARSLAVFACFALAAPAARAQDLEDYDYENLTFQGVGLDVGYIWPSKVEPTTKYGLHFDLGFLGPGVRIAPSIAYWSSTMQQEELDRLAGQLSRLPALDDRGIVVSGDELAPIDWSNLSVAVDGHFVWATPVPLFPYLGAGLGLHALNGQGASIDDTFVEDLLDSITPSINAIAGIDWVPHDRVRIHAEGRYTLLTDLHYPGVRVGVMLLLPQRGTAGTADPQR